MSGQRVLIADSDEYKLHALGDAFHEAGFEVLMVNDGVKAVMAAKQAGPDIAVIDVLLPIINGFEVTSRIKEDPETRAIPVMLRVPFYVSPKDIDRGHISLSRKHELCADIYLMHSTTPEQIVESATKMISGEPRKDHTAAISVLVVDENMSDIRLIKSVAKQEGLKIHLAETVAEAKQLISSLKPDLTVLDICLPQMSGLEVLEFLRSQIPHAAVVVMTAYTSEQAMHECLKHGIDGILLKPLNLHEFRVSLSNALEKIRLRSENKEFSIRLKEAAIEIMQNYEELVSCRQKQKSFNPMAKKTISEETAKSL